MPTITTSDGVDIFYKDWGSGQPIVFSHGWPLSADDWDNQMLFFLARGYRVIAHDRRGHGRSSQVADNHDMDHYADDLAAVVETRPARCDPRRTLHRGRRGGALSGPPRREPCGQGRADQCGATADGEDRRQPRGAAQGGVRRPAGAAGRQQVGFLPRLRRDPSMVSTARASSRRRRSSRTGGARA